MNERGATPWDTLSFDCYGTLVDWETGIATAFNREAARDGVELTAAQVIAAYHAVEPQVQSADYRSYRQVLADVALEVARRLGWPLSPERKGFLAESLPDWPVFADTRPALERLQARFELAILSNIDDDLLKATIARIGIRFAWTITAEQVRSYKPAAEHFRRAVERLGGQRGRLLHVAQSRFHDIRPASELGIASVWVNRQAEELDADLRPVRVVGDLGELADWLGPEGSIR